MVRRHARALTWLAVALVVGGLPMTAYAGSSHAAVDKNWARVQNHAPGPATRLAFSVWSQTKHTTLTSNRAQAVSSECAGCTTYAAAFSVALVNATQVKADNSAVAVNYECADCVSAAAAYQFVIVTNEDITLTSEALAALAEVRNELQDLMDNPPGDPFVFETAAAGLAGQVAGILLSGTSYQTGHVNGQLLLDTHTEDSRGNARSSTNRTYVRTVSPNSSGLDSLAA